MTKILRRFVRKLFNRSGYEIIRLDNNNAWLEDLNISTIIDVGANEGQFINRISKILPGKKIFAFEPIKTCYDRLVANTRQHNVTAYNCGLSDHNGKTEINISENFVSSSILPITNLTTDLYPDSKYINKQKIELRRLDDVMSGLDLEQNTFLKIDVQGYEEKVLAGSLETLKKIKLVLIEFSYQPLYDGQWLFDQTYVFFTSHGFRFAGVIDQSFSETGLPVYGDAIFIRN